LQKGEKTLKNAQRDFFNQKKKQKNSPCQRMKQKVSCSSFSHTCIKTMAQHTD